MAHGVWRVQVAPEMNPFDAQVRRQNDLMSGGRRNQGGVISDP